MWTRVWIVSIALLAQQLPPPFETPWFRKPTRVVPMPDGHQLIVPRGFGELVAKAIVPDVLLPPHAAALGLLFYTGAQFPAVYRKRNGVTEEERRRQESQASRPAARRPTRRTTVFFVRLRFSVPPCERPFPPSSS